MGLMTRGFQLRQSVELWVDGEILEPEDLRGRPCSAYFEGERDLEPAFQNKTRDLLGAMKLGEMMQDDGVIRFRGSLSMDAAPAVLVAVAPNGLNEIMLHGTEAEDGTVEFDSFVFTDHSQEYPIDNDE
jgi:hypothetical protein